MVRNYTRSFLGNSAPCWKRPALTPDWGTSENNRKAKFYSITKSGLKQLARETADWEQISGVIGRVLRLEGQK